MCWEYDGPNSPHYQPPRDHVREKKLNDSDREDWINNDEGLYNWQRGSGLSMRNFIRANRAAIDEHINTQLNKKPR